MTQPMNSKTVRVSIKCKPERVYEFILDLKNMPKWAKTYCLSIENSGDTWTIMTQQGKEGIKIAEKNTLGVLDHYITTASGKKVYVPVRVVPNGDHSEVLFTVFQRPEMSDKNFTKDIKLVKKDLMVLKGLLE